MMMLHLQHYQLIQPINKQDLQIKQLQDEKDVLIRQIFEHQALQTYSVADDSIASEH